MRASLRTLTTAVIACAGLGGAYALGASGGGSGSPVTPESSFVPTSPVAAVNTSLSGPLTSAADCDEALGWYVDRALEQVGPYGWEGGSGIYSRDMVMETASSLGGAAPAAKSPLSAANSSETGTNVQEAGVDEPDVAKTDGTLALRLMGGVLTIFDVSGDAPSQLASLSLPKVTEDAQLLLVGDRAVIISTDRYKEWQGPVTRVTTVDLADPEAPTIANTQSVDAGFVAAYQHDTTVRLVLTKGLPPLDFVQPSGRRGIKSAAEHNRQLVRDSSITDWMPQLTTGSATAPLVECEALSQPATDGGLGTLTVMTLDTADDADPAASSSALLTASQIAYASTEHLVVVSTGWGGWCCWDVVRGMSGSGPEAGTTQLDVFTLDGATTTYAASGQVDGTIRDRWSIDEDKGTIRVAVGPSEATGNFNSVITLKIDGDHVTQVGRIDELGKREEIKSVRWFGDLAIVVTFRQIDPLYVIDLRDPAKPTLKGKLKIPGFSEYLHPLGPERLIGIGQAAGPRGMTLGAQAALFNLEDLGNPRQVAVHRFDRRMYALAGQQPHQFTWLADQRTALTVVTDGYGARTGWVAALHLDKGKFVTTMTKAGYGRSVDSIRLLPLPSGKVVMINGDGATFLDL
ncbi:MAG: beta-propeller domain-containing protein [Nocardioides sp.]